MFQSARIKLTIWYAGIIMCISFFFSLIIYTGVHNELHRFEHLHQLRMEREQVDLPFPLPSPRFGVIDPVMIEETRKRIIFELVLINLGILCISSASAYFLSGRTLSPIKDMMDEQNRFITDASHELRTPLTSLRSEIEVNLRDKSLSLDNSKKLLESNLEEVIHLQTLSDHLMELTQYKKNNGTVNFERVSLMDIVDSAITKISPLARKKHIMILNTTKEYSLKGSRQSLIELFIILLDNAVKYSTKNKKIYITSTKTDHTIRIAVKDEGIGISTKDIPHIFDRFFRADKSRSKEYINGYGLGLAIASEIVHLHNGKIAVESELKKGSVFIITLPQFV